jgi:hypothetical protein
MSKNRFLAPKGKNLPLKLRGNPLSFAFSDRWFVYPRPDIAVKFLGGGAKLHNFIRNLKPTLSTFQVYKIDYCARYAAMRTGGNAQNICSRFLENSDSIWDFRDFEKQFQDIASTIPVTESGQIVNVIKPLTGANHLSTFSPYVGGISNSNNGVIFSDSPKCAYKLTNRQTQVKAVIIVNKPSNIYTIGLTDTGYPWFLGDTVNTYNFHASIDGATTIFDPSFSFENLASVSFKLNNVGILKSNIIKYYSSKILSVRVSGSDSLIYDSIASDRSSVINTARRFVGDYRFLLSSNFNYNDSELNELNVMCQLYSGLI